MKSSSLILQNSTYQYAMHIICSTHNIYTDWTVSASSTPQQMPIISILSFPKKLVCFLLLLLFYFLLFQENEVIMQMLCAVRNGYSFC